MVAAPNITKFSQLYDVPAGDGIWTRESGVLVWSPKDAITWRAPVNAVINLPAVGNTIGDVRVVKADATIWVFTSTGWVQSAGAGGVGLPPGTVLNLFVQANEPAAGSVTMNSLWINVDPAGVPEYLGTWEVRTDAAWSGSNGNLYIQVNAPSPAVDAVWIPLNADLTAKYISDWVVFTGRGSVVGVGNPNLYIQATEPLTPVAGSLWVPLNADQTPKTPDLWQVYA